MELLQGKVHWEKQEQAQHVQASQDLWKVRWERRSHRSGAYNLHFYLRPEYCGSEVVFRSFMETPVYGIGLANDDDNVIFAVGWQIPGELGICNRLNLFSAHSHPHLMQPLHKYKTGNDLN